MPITGLRVFLINCGELGEKDQSSPSQVARPDMKPDKHHFVEEQQPSEALHEQPE